MRSSLLNLITGILPDVTRIERPPPVALEEQLEELGRVLLVVQRECEVRNLMHGLDFQGVPGQGSELA